MYSRETVLLSKALIRNWDGYINFQMSLTNRNFINFGYLQLRFLYKKNQLKMHQVEGNLYS